MYNRLLRCPVLFSGVQFDVDRLVISSEFIDKEPDLNALLFNVTFSDAYDVNYVSAISAPRIFAQSKYEKR